MYCNKCGQETSNPRLCDACIESCPPTTKILSGIDIDALSERLIHFGILTCIVCVLWWANTYSFAKDKIFSFTTCLYSNDVSCSISTLLLGDFNKITYNSNFLWIGVISLIIGKVIKQNNIKSNELAEPVIHFKAYSTNEGVKKNKVETSLKDSKGKKLINRRGNKTYCKECSSEYDIAQNFCGQCGHKHPPVPIKNNKPKRNLIKYLSVAILLSLLTYEGIGIYDHSKVSYLESIVGYQYDFKSGKKLFLTKRNGQYYFFESK
jgi:hypothetical protein